jgi:hypothetical protein
VQELANPCSNLIFLCPLLYSFSEMELSQHGEKMDKEIIALWSRKLGCRSAGSDFTPEIRLERRFTAPDFEGELYLQKT